MRRVAVFVDWQNTYGCAREAFHSEFDPTRYGNVRLRALAELLTEKGDAGDVLKEEAGSPDVAVIGWGGTSQHLEVPGVEVPVRWIGKMDYEAIRDRTDYNISPADRYR